MERFIIIKIEIWKEVQQIIHVVNFYGFGAITCFNSNNAISWITSIHKIVTFKFPSLISWSFLPWWVEINMYFFNWRKKRWGNHCLDPWELKQNQLENLQQKLSLWWWHFEISNHIFLELLFMNVNIWKREVNNRINCSWKYGKNDNRTSYVKY